MRKIVGEELPKGEELNGELTRGREHPEPHHRER